MKLTEDDTKWWKNMTVEDMKKANPHVSHLVGKSIDELKIMFPDAKVCTGVNCEFDNLDHAIFMEYEQNQIDIEREKSKK